MMLKSKHLTYSEGMRLGSHPVQTQFPFRIFRPQPCSLTPNIIAEDHVPKRFHMERDWQDLSGSRVVFGENSLLGLMID